MYVRTRQRVVTEFITAEGFSPIEVHRRLRSVYGEDAIDVSSVRRWVRRFKGDEKDIGDRPGSALAKSFTRPAYSVSRKGGKSVSIMKGTLWKNCINFVKNVPMIYINFIIIVLIVSENKYKALLSYLITCSDNGPETAPQLTGFIKYILRYTL